MNHETRVNEAAAWDTSVIKQSPEMLASSFLDDGLGRIIHEADEAEA